MTLEQTLKWKHGSIVEYEKVLKEQEIMLKRIKKINDDIEWTLCAMNCFNQSNNELSETYKIFKNKYHNLIREKEKLGILIKENNERLEKEFY